MLRYIVLDKAIGQTPLEVLNEWKREHPDYLDVSASYAGRLDPMASGKLLVLLGEECKRQKHYTGLDKEYEVSILLDLATDTGDVLGLPTYSTLHTEPSLSAVQEVLSNELGTRSHKYPAYSSKTVEGIPLFLHALRGTLGDIEIPTHSETIFSIRLVDTHHLPADAVYGYISQALRVVPRDDAPSKKEGADFRQDEIREAWQLLFAKIPERTFTIIKIRVVCGTGTYMRSLAERVGHALGTTALAVSIHRTKIGKRRTLGPLSFFSPSF